MSNPQSYREQTGMNAQTHISSLSEGYLEFLRQNRTDWDARDFMIRKLLKYRFSELPKLTNARPGTGFVLEIDRDTFAAGVYGKADPLRTGFSIITVPYSAEAIEVGSRSHETISGSSLSAVRFVPMSTFNEGKWLSTPLSIHGIANEKTTAERSFASGDAQQDPGYFMIPAPDKPASGNRKAERQYDLVIGSPGEQGKGKNDYPTGFLLGMGVGEKEFNDARVNLIPSFVPSEAGYDRSMIMAYGAHERMGAYAVMKAVTDVTVPNDTSIIIFHSGPEGRKNALRKAMADVVGKVSDKLPMEKSRENMDAIMDSSRILSIRDISPKQAASDKPADPISAGAGPIVGVTGAATKANKSTHFLGLMQSAMEKKGIPFQKVPKQYSFEASAADEKVLKQLAASINLAYAAPAGENIVAGAVSKIDLWAVSRAVSTFLAY